MEKLRKKVLISFISETRKLSLRLFMPFAYVQHIWVA